MRARAGASVLAALAVVLLLAPSASAANPGEEVGLSRDGVTWSPDLTTDLFDPAMVWVPGDDEVTTLYVRNQSGEPARGFAQVLVGPEDAEFAEDLRVRTRYDGGAWTVGATSRTTGFAVGAVLRIDIGVQFDPVSGNESEGRAVPLAVRVVLASVIPGRDVDPTPSPGTPVGGAGGGAVPAPAGAPVVGDVAAGDGAVGAGAAVRYGGLLGATGADALRVLVAAGVLVLTGAWFLVARRHRRGAP
ncbi:hypothetical protein [Cellulomonas denverensis]|uniref:Gram-positive cocci surface proteins LPxTG domain-containing protein n=1 Tax=Cellulomonas denverensis TaxID=264297 RepID=A0A7X6KX27_9CELL|nr:hypothetical protein [Cellulomonas denverensis]NKY23653.1 hypothetical protein [Cellulomonas denverensis]GIG26866.1 hypothetical protein Cde04nite_31100 [Cellulomonas denverensis]